MGKPVGKLPAEYISSPIFEELFGNQSLLTYHSSLPGMTHRLAISIAGYQVHLGFRNGHLIVRGCQHDTVVELVPREIFRSQLSYDLPSSLIDKCYHWLD